MPRSRATPRKVIQIAYAQSYVEDQGIFGSFFALCNDGTMWLHIYPPREGRPLWERVRAVPQIEEAE
jgi:hypothetical protein